MLEKYLNLELELFDPKIIKYDFFILNGYDAEDLFMDNSKVVNGVNLYQEYLLKNYFSKLDNAFGGYKYRAATPKIALCQTENGTTLKFSFSQFLMDILKSFVLISDINKIIDGFNSIEDVEDSFKDLLREERKRYLDVYHNMEDSPYYEKCYELYKRINEGETLKEFIESVTNNITAYITSFKYFKQVFDKEIDYHELMSMFDYDKLCLCITKSAIDYNIRVYNSKEIDGVDISYLFVCVYDKTVNKLKEINPNYNVTIKVGDKHYNSNNVSKFMKLISDNYDDMNISVITLEEAYEKLLMFHKKSDIDKMSAKEFTSSLSAIIDRNDEDNTYFASWELLPKGEGEGGNVNSLYTKSNNEYVYDDKIELLNKSREFIESSPYSFKLYGKGDFLGYVAYIYNTGTVVLEKINDKITKDHNTIFNATYIMDYQNFMEFSMMSKSSIIDGIKSGELTGVRRIFHTNFESWSSKINSAINKSEYTEDVLNYINTLIRENQIRPRGI